MKMDRREFLKKAGLGSIALGSLPTLINALATPTWAQGQRSFTFTKAPHGGEVKVTGNVSDKLIQRFGASGLSGASSIEYRRLTMKPGARMEGLMVMDDHAEFCFVEKGAVTMTTAAEAKRTYRAGDVFKPRD